MAENSYAVVAVPLTADPPILGGMRLQDLVWPVAAIVVDMMMWRHGGWTNVMAYIARTLILSLGFLVAMIRIQTRSLPEWAVIIANFLIQPRRYLP